VKGIIFTAESILGLKRRVKTQTRRVAKNGASPRYKVGETLYAKEAWDYVGGNEYLYQEERGAVLYRQDQDDGTADPTQRKWRIPLFMPGWAARYHITIAEVRTQRLREITASDAWAEGIEVIDGQLDGAEIFRCAHLAGVSHEDPQASYLAAWDTIHRWPDQVENNPMVHAYTFTARST
jgi:hypothetical protein